MDRCGEDGKTSAAATITMRRLMHVNLHMFFQTSNSPAMNLRASCVRGVAKNSAAGRGFDQPAAMQQHDVAGEPLGLAEIVGRHHDLDAARAHRAHDVLDRFGGGGSRLAVGSSRNSTAGSRASARASASRCCSPPDSRRAGRSPRLAESDPAAVRRRVRCASRAARRRPPVRSAHCRRRCAGAWPGVGTRWRAARALRLRGRPR